MDRRCSELGHIGSQVKEHVFFNPMTQEDRTRVPSHHRTQTKETRYSQAPTQHNLQWRVQDLDFLHKNKNKQKKGPCGTYLPEGEPHACPAHHWSAS